MAQPEDKALRIPSILLPSYNSLMKASSRQQGQADLKRIAVQCGVCRLTRYYALTRGITHINKVVACEACRHCYQAFKRQPEQLHCSKSDGSCLQMSLFTKTMCRCCWVAQIIEYTPLPAHLYHSFIQFLPPYVRNKLRGHPIAASSLTQQQRGFLSLEVHTGADWKDVTSPAAVAQQRMPFTDDPLDAELGEQTTFTAPSTSVSTSATSNTAPPPPPRPTTATTPATVSSSLPPPSARLPSPASNIKKTIESIINDFSSSSNSSSSSDLTSNVNSFVRPQMSSRGKNVAIRGKKMRGRGPYKGAVLTGAPEEKSSFALASFPTATRGSCFRGRIAGGKATKSTRGGTAKRGRGGGKKGPSKVERLMAGIKEGLYGMTVSDDDGNKTFPSTKPTMLPGTVEVSSSSAETSTSNSGAPSPTPNEDDVTVEEEFEEASTSRTEGPMIGLLHSEQVKYLKDFNPRNSNRVRRKKDRVEYFDNPKEKKTQEVLVYDHKGRFISNDRALHDVCDCLRSDCPGCHFPCPKCRSLKCGAECRINRKWFYERVDVEGTDQFYMNEYSK